MNQPTLVLLATARESPRGRLRFAEMDPQTLEIEFAGELYYWRGPSPFHFVRVPEEVSLLLRDVSTYVTYGWGMIPVTIRIGDTVFETALFPKDGGYVVPIKDIVRKTEDLTDGDTVQVDLAIRS
jgi:hypothetical protein